MEDDAFELLEVARELTPAERELVEQMGRTLWGDVTNQASARAAGVYAVTGYAQFVYCLNRHLDAEQRRDMVTADVYNCPVCGRLLKDRKTPIASSILQERRRIARLFHDLEDAPEGHHREEARRRLLAALGE